VIDGPAVGKQVQITTQNLIFNFKECSIIQIRDISNIAENLRLQADNKLLNLVSSSVNHKVLTPLKCMLQIIKKVKDKITHK